jgi:sec-independent protein translocase protein TatC
MRKYSLQEHLSELKNRLVIVLSSFALACIVCYYFSDEIYAIILSPLKAILSAHERKIIYTGLAEAFFAYLKISVFAAFLLILPIICYQIYGFLKPGLYKSEQKIFASILTLAPFLFYSGCFFMFYLVMPRAWEFFLSYEKNDIGLPLVLEARISEYLNLVIQLSYAFGFSFELPVIMLSLNLLGIVDANSLKNRRRIAIVIIFIVAAIFTPPDVFSQIALAIPLVLLYEFSILLCVWLEKRKQKNDRYKMD